MGVEYRHYLVPIPNDFQPDAKTFLSLIDRLTDANWLFTPSQSIFGNGWTICSAANETMTDDELKKMNVDGNEFVEIPHMTLEWLIKAIENDFAVGFNTLDWPKIGTKYPLTVKPEFEDSCLSMEFHFSQDFELHESECIEPFRRSMWERLTNVSVTRCLCGEELRYSKKVGKYSFTQQKIKRRCPKCSRRFDVTNLAAPVRNGFDGSYRDVPGGCCFRFAIIIDLEKSIPAGAFAGAILKAMPEFLELCSDSLACRFNEIGEFY